MTTISIEKTGRRYYLIGDTYPIRKQLGDADCHWDGERRAWWTSKLEVAERFASGAGSQPARIDGTHDEPGLSADATVVGRARYKGRECLVVWTGTTKRGPAAKLASMDGKRVWWADAGEVEISKTYQARYDSRSRRDIPMTFGKLQRLREEYADQRQAEKEADQLVGDRGQYTARFTASRGNRLPTEQIGQASWLRHAGRRIAVVLVGYQSATCLRSDDAEDMGEYGLESGWYGTAYYRAATRDEYTALQASSPRADGVCVEEIEVAATP